MLKNILIKAMRLQGGISIAQYMNHCLYHPQYGYYSGTSGAMHGIGASDFTTAPEISQLFGELLAFYMLEQWLAYYQSVEKIHFVEIGAGRGTMMLDMLRIFKTQPKFYNKLNIIIIEKSPALQKMQQARLKQYAVSWYESLDELAFQAPIFMVGNEILDSLAIEQFILKNDQEAIKIPRKVNYDEDRQCFVFEPFSEQGKMICEHSPEQIDFIKKIGNLIKQQGGIGLLIDYGYEGESLGDSLQAIYKGKPTHPLTHCGAADLTAQVAFTPLINCLEKIGLQPELRTQARFLHAIGGGEALNMRLNALIEKANEANKRKLMQGVYRLTSAQEMGQLFKILSF